MKYKELTQGEIYRFKSRGDSDYRYIVCITNKFPYVSEQFVSYYDECDDIDSHPSYIFKEASDEDKAWLSACISAGKFIPLKDVQFIKNEYSIF